MMSLPVWLTGLMFLLGVSVSGPMFLPEGVFVQGFSVQVGLGPGRDPPTVTSGRYASYWNSFLFSTSFCCRLNLLLDIQMHHFDATYISKTV